MIVDCDNYSDFDPQWFEPDRWHAAGALTHSTTGRGSVLMLDRGGETWVYRHYHRGGLVAHFIYDHYLWTGLERSRPFREWRLLDFMHERALPSPQPVAARLARKGPFYRADIITVLLPDTRPLSSILVEAWADSELWSRIGTMVARFHALGVDHPDLTAHNILVDTQGQVFLVDFDNALCRSGVEWRATGVARLKRSLQKVALETGTAFSAKAWSKLFGAYTDYQP